MGLAVSDFTISANPTAVTAAAGGSATSTLTVSTQSGFAGTVDLACAPPSTGAEIGCQIQPASVTLGSGSTSQTAVLTVDDLRTTLIPDHRGPVRRGDALAALAFLAVPLRRRRSRPLWLGLLLVGSASCGGGGGGGGSAAAPPAAPANLVATPGDLEVTLTWTESSHSTHFGVSRATSSTGPFSRIATPSAASFVDTGLTAGATYYYLVEADGAGGRSADTGPVAATPTQPGTPAGSYTIVVNATSGAAVRTTAVGLTAQ